MNASAQLKTHFNNLIGQRIKQKIVVFESDDWGGVRIPNQAISEKWIDRKVLSNTNYNRFDILENSDDLSFLAEVLTSVRDSKGNSPIFTANFVMSNPDFDRILATNYQQYFYQHFLDSYNETHSQQSTKAQLWQNINEKVFFPQFHGREHVHVEKWMNNLKVDKLLQDAFADRLFCFSANEIGNESYLAAFSTFELGYKDSIITRIFDGLKMFEQTFGFRSQTVIAPENSMDPSFYKVLSDFGVLYAQGAPTLKVYNQQQKRYQIVRRRRGYDKASNITHLVRNVTFEPTASDTDWVDKSMREIEIAFMWKKPAIICSHRVNYVGGIEVRNRDKGLSELRKLLQKIVKKWPEVEFMTSASLGDLMSGNSKEQVQNR